MNDYLIILSRLSSLDSIEDFHNRVLSDAGYCHGSVLMCCVELVSRLILTMETYQKEAKKLYPVFSDKTLSYTVKSMMPDRKKTDLEQLHEQYLETVKEITHELKEMLYSPDLTSEEKELLVATAVRRVLQPVSIRKESYLSSVLIADDKSAVKLFPFLSDKDLADLYREYKKASYYGILVPLQKEVAKKMKEEIGKR